MLPRPYRPLSQGALPLVFLHGPHQQGEGGEKDRPLFYLLPTSAAWLPATKGPWLSIKAVHCTRGWLHCASYPRTCACPVPRLTPITQVRVHGCKIRSCPIWADRQPHNTPPTPHMVAGAASPHPPTLGHLPRLPALLTPPPGQSHHRTGTGSPDLPSRLPPQPGANLVLLSTLNGVRPGEVASVLSVPV